MQFEGPLTDFATQETSKRVIFVAQPILYFDLEGSQRQAQSSDQSPETA